jgi:hypothetical protein
VALTSRRRVSGLQNAKAPAKLRRHKDKPRTELAFGPGAVHCQSVITNQYIQITVMEIYRSSSRSCGAKATPRKTSPDFAERMVLIWPSESSLS